jgi:RES domain-containing protein
MRTVWRITTARFARHGLQRRRRAALRGRWNPKGCEVVYTAESQSLALLELMVQDDPLRAHYILIPAHLPSGLPETRIDAEQLPGDWRTIGARDVLHAIGQAWLQDMQTAVLSVPSAVVPAERNYLLNPATRISPASRSASPNRCKPIPACCAISANRGDGSPWAKRSKAGCDGNGVYLSLDVPAEPAGVSGITEPLLMRLV